MHNEKGVKNAVVRRLRKYGAWYTFPHQSGYSARGVPDILVCYKGRFIAIECKFGKNKVTALQQVQLEQIAKQDGIAVIINEDNISSVTFILENIK